MKIGEKCFAVVREHDGKLFRDQRFLPCIFDSIEAADATAKSIGGLNTYRTPAVVILPADDYAEMIELIESLVMQGCHYTGDRKLESNFIIAYADGLRWLAKFGRVKLEEDAGRFVTARLIDPDKDGTEEV